VFYFAVRWLFWPIEVGVWTLVLHAFTLGVYGGSYFLITTLAKPTYEGEELVDGGADLSAGGPCECFFDLIYITAAAQLLGLITSYANYLLLADIAVAAYAVYAKVMAVARVASKSMGMASAGAPKHATAKK
jgi:hypothetical protein